MFDLDEFAGLKRLEEYIDYMMPRIENPGDGDAYVHTGLEALDSNVLVSIGMHAYEGKTGLLTTVLSNFLKNKTRVLLYTPQTSFVDVFNRLMAYITHVDLKHFESGKLDEYEIDAFSNATDRFSDNNIYIVDNIKMNADEFVDLAKNAVREKNIEVVLVDDVDTIPGVSSIAELNDKLRHIRIPVVSTMTLGDDVYTLQDAREAFGPIDGRADYCIIRRDGNEELYGDSKVLQPTMFYILGRDDAYRQSRIDYNIENMYFFDHMKYENLFLEKPFQE